MKVDAQIFRPRFETLCREVIGPSIYLDAERLEVGAWGTDQRFAIDKARAARFEPVGLPHPWGPAWSTAWFRISGRVPERFAGKAVHLRFDPGTEATVWVGNDPVRGLDENRDSVDLGLLNVDNSAGMSVEVLVEAACNHPFGDQVFPWDSRERGEKWRSATPGLVSRAELAVFDETVWRLHRRMLFATQLLAELEPESVRAQDLYACLRHAADAVDDADVAESAAGALAILNDGLGRAAGGSTPRLICVAHAHIDTAWLWTLAETRRKVVRSWTNTLDLMDRDPALHFMCSQPQQYKWLESDAPAVFERIRKRAAEGRWEPAGSMWVEPDALVPSGESLMRQMLYGVRYFESRFGEQGRQRVVYLPDTFGFPACLPTVMRACGADVFITNKISWNQANTFPHTSFRWRGLDGSEVLAHNTPGGDYNATLTPKELRKATANVRGRDAAGLTGPAVALQPFGFGDGGGGPTADMLERAHAASDCEGLPRAELGSVAGFLDALEQEDERAGGLPVWSGPLDLELHRGVLTTHAWLKRANRAAERELRVAELMAFGRAEEPGSASRATQEVQHKLDEAWERTLLNQFHDILPGSSIGPVYEDARRDHAEIATIAAEVQAGAVAAGDKPFVLNAASDGRRVVVEDRGTLRLVEAAAFGLHPLEEVRPNHPVRLEGKRVTNGLVSFEVDEAGRLGHLAHVGGVDLAAERPLNELRLYRDRPMNWDAWDIDLDYERNLVWTNESAASVEIVRADALRAEVRVTHRMGSSAYTQVFRLDADSPVVEVTTEIDWRERHRMLRVESTPPVSCERVTVGTQFGFVTRPTHRNTSWDRFAFEFACHRWMDAAQPGRGLAVVSDALYGRSAHGRTLGLSLLRSPTHPDPQADQGANTLRYGYLPHAGDWRAADVDRHAEAFGEPARMIRAGSGVAPMTVRCEQGGRVEIAAFKRAADGPGRVLRVVETRGMHSGVDVAFASASRVRRVDGLERAIAGEGCRDGASVRLEVRPFEIVTLLAE
jgi:alpha-mannosidase